MVTKEQTLLKALAEGKESAYSLFYQEYYQILCSFASKYITNPEDIKDIINDIIIEFYCSHKQFPTIIALKSYLFKTIRNRCLNHLRHQEVVAEYILEYKETEEYYEESVIKEEVYYLLNNTISSLSPVMQKIFKLSLSSKSDEEIAQALSLTIDSVKSYKKRGRQQLREKLKGLYYLLSITI